MSDIKPIIVNIFVRKNIEKIASTVVWLLLFLIAYIGWGQQFITYLYQFSFVKELMNPDLSKSFEAVFIISFIYATFLAYRHIYRSKSAISYRYILIAVILTFIITDCRYSGRWVYSRFSIFGYSIAYLDALVLLLWIPVITAIPHILQNISARKEDYHNFDNDLPIESSNEDLLDRTVFAEKLSQKISDIKVRNGSSAICIIAPWGNGKTSFLNLIREAWSKTASKDLVVEFSPWAYAEGTNLTTAFYEQLIAAVSPLDSALSKDLKDYLSVLSDSNVPGISALFRTLNKRNLDLKTLYERVFRRLQSSDRTYIIIIDDLDRLESDEILEVLKIIRGSANFPNLKFICAFDKTYILKALNDKSVAITDKFLEKFFQIEYWLPSYDERRLRDIIFNYASGFIEKEDIAAFKEYLNYCDNSIFHKQSMNPVKNGITNLRIAMRWVKAIELSYHNLKGEINIADLADLELLKIIAPEIYEQLRNNWQSLTNNDRGKLVLWEEKEKTGDRNKDFISSILKNDKNYLFKTGCYLSLDEETRSAVKNILSRILPDYGSSKKMSFNNQFYINRYFYQTLQDDEITKSEFLRLMDLPFDEYKATIDSPKYSNKSKWLSIHFSKCEFETTEDILNYIRKLFYAGKIYGDSLIFDPINIMSQLQDFTKDKGIIKKAFSEAIDKNGASGYTLKFLEILRHHCSPSYYEPFFESDFPIPEATVLLKHAIEENLPLSEVCSFYWSTVRTKYEHNNGPTKEIEVHNDFAKELFRSYWEKNMTSLHRNLIENVNPHERIKIYRISNLAYTLWGKELSDLIDLLEKLKEDHDIERTLEFIKEFKRQDKPTLAFNF